MAVSLPFVRRFVAGTTYADTVPHLQKLAEQGIRTTLNLLGEDYSDKKQAQAMLREYLSIIEQLPPSDCYLSIKLTMLGLSLGEDFCQGLLTELLSAAAQRQVFVRLDMEGSNYTEKTLSIYEQVKRQYPNVGIVIQAYLHRTVADLARLKEVDARIRLCKGAYKESPTIAYQSLADIRRNYLRLTDSLLKDFSYPAFATHDDYLIEQVRTLADQYDVADDRFEFQMLYGMRRRAWSRLRAQGHNLRVYLPFGDNWFPYYRRRLLERKENIYFLLRNLFRA